jgi:hypothetical protein
MLAKRMLTALAAATLLAALGTAPAHATQPAGPQDALDTPQGTNATVMVRNYNMADVEIYAVSEAGRRFHLGTVNRMSGRTLALPATLVNGTQFRLKIYTYEPRRAASVVRRLTEGVKTNALSISAGQQIELMVNSPLTESFINH